MPDFNVKYGGFGMKMRDFRLKFGVFFICLFVLLKMHDLRAEYRIFGVKILWVKISFFRGARFIFGIKLVFWGSRLSSKAVGDISNR